MRTRVRALLGASVLLFGASAVVLGASGAHAAEGCQDVAGGLVCYAASGQSGVCVEGKIGGQYAFMGVDCFSESETGVLAVNQDPALFARALVFCNTRGSPPTWTIVVFVNQVGTPIDSTVHC